MPATQRVWRTSSSGPDQARAGHPHPTEAPPHPPVPPGVSLAARASSRELRRCRPRRARIGRWWWGRRWGRRWWRRALWLPVSRALYMCLVLLACVHVHSRRPTTRSLFPHTHMHAHPSTHECAHTQRERQMREIVRQTQTDSLSLARFQTSSRPPPASLMTFPQLCSSLSSSGFQLKPALLCARFPILAITSCKEARQ